MMKAVDLAGDTKIFGSSITQSTFFIANREAFVDFETQKRCHRFKYDKFLSTQERRLKLLRALTERWLLKVEGIKP